MNGFYDPRMFVRISHLLKFPTLTVHTLKVCWIIFYGKKDRVNRACKSLEIIKYYVQN
jgi:hypothetical protein